MRSRIKTFRVYWKQDFELINKFDGIVKDEKEIHQKFKLLHIEGEFFDFNQALIAHIKRFENIKELDQISLS